MAVHTQRREIESIENLKKRERRRRNRNSGNISDTSSTDSSSESSSASPQQTKRKNKSKKRQKGQKKQQQQQQPELTPEECQKYVALDCEMVGIGTDGRRSALARVTLIDWNGVALLDELIKQEQEVTDYRTFVSGITPAALSEANMTLDTCRRTVSDLLQDKILVGHGLKNDLRALGISHPWYMTRDTAKYEPFMKVRFNDGILWPRSLKDLMKEKLNKDIQAFGKPHCPKEDAMAALHLYRLVRTKWEKVMDYKISKTREIESSRS